VDRRKGAMGITGTEYKEVIKTGQDARQETPLDEDFVRAAVQSLVQEALEA